LLHISNTIDTVPHKELVRVASPWWDTAFKMWAGYREIWNYRIIHNFSLSSSTSSVHSI